MSAFRVYGYEVFQVMKFVCLFVLVGFVGCFFNECFLGNTDWNRHEADRG